MPPKKKGSSKKPAKEKTPITINGLTKEEMSKEQLEEMTLRLREDLDREREERNYFQLERDMIQSFCKVSERNLAEVQGELENLEKEMEDDETHHQVEIKVYKQKMKHLLFEHQNTTCELEAEGVVSVEAELKDQERLEKELQQETRELMVDTQLLQYETLVRELETKHREEMTATKKRWEETLAEFADKSLKKMQQMQQEQEKTRETALSDRQQGWSNHVSALRDDSDRSFQIQPHVIREKNIDAVKVETNISENEKLQECKKTELRALLQENKRLAELVSHEENKQSAGVQKRIDYYSEKTDVLEKTKMKKLNALRREEEALQEKFNELQLETEETEKAFVENIGTMQQEADAAVAKLQQEVEALVGGVEETKARISSVLSASNLDHAALRALENFDHVNAKD